VTSDPDGASSRFGDRYDRVIEAIDRVNANDPVTIVVDGQVRPKELVHAERMTHWVGELDPDAGELALVAARAHHLRRWALPRDAYPDGRAGYLKWRTEQQRRHAAEVADLMVEAGYEPDEIGRVGEIIRKVRLRTDPVVQTHEDALCLVFLELQLDELDERIGDDKMVDVLRKTMAKMSATAIQRALASSLEPGQRALLERASAAD
jgi:hypothetical protein